ncbi:RidA family protein [Sphingosinicellaceae bacterium]|nr:RidA family protein [Sphingosinicellaceae bacterium]
MSARALLPDGWPVPKGYANGMAATGRLVVTAGVVGWDAEGRFAEGLAAQCALAFANIVAILAEGGAVPADVVKLTWYITSREAYLAEVKAIGAAYRAAFGGHYPAMAVVQVTGLMEAAALVEIEATAVVGV